MPACMILSLALSAASVQEDINLNPNVAEEPTWSFGVGLSTGPLLSFGTPAGLGGLSGAPALQLGVERRLGEDWWLLVDVGGSFSDTDNPNIYRQRSAGADAFVGARYGWQLGESVTLSPWFGLSAAYHRWWFEDVDAADTGRFAPTSSVSMRLSAGAAIEYAFNKHLSLRITTPVVQGAWTRQEVESDNNNAISSVTVAAVLEPRLELRVYF